MLCHVHVGAKRERERVRRDKERDHDKKLRERWNVDRAAHSLTHSSYTLSLSGRKRKDHRDVLTSATDRSLWGRHTRVLLTRRESDIHLSVRGVCLSLSCSCVWEREREWRRSRVNHFWLLSAHQSVEEEWREECWREKRRRNWKSSEEISLYNVQDVKGKQQKGWNR